MTLLLWIKPQLTKLVDQAPEGPDWLHEIKFDGYRMHARLDRGTVRLLTRTGLDWTHKYPAIAAAVASLPARQAYLDGELCGISPDGTTSFSLIQNASDSGHNDVLVFFLFDLLHLDGKTIGSRPLGERKALPQTLRSGAGSTLHYSDHQIGRGRAFYDRACVMKVEGIHLVARINSQAQPTPRSDIYGRRTYSGRPSSSIRFSEPTAMATSVVCRPPVRERSASPITRL